jgi:hypothetical protein
MFPQKAKSIAEIDSKTYPLGEKIEHPADEASLALVALSHTPVERRLYAAMLAAEGVSPDLLTVTISSSAKNGSPSVRSATAIEGRCQDAAETPPLSESLTNHYRELLRAHVIMGSGNLSHEMASLAELLADNNVTAPQTMRMHVQGLEELVHGLGSRSARHVMTRADLLLLDVLVHLAERYRLRCQT